MRVFRPRLGYFGNGERLFKQKSFPSLGAKEIQLNIWLQQKFDISLSFHPLFYRLLYVYHFGPCFSFSLRKTSFLSRAFPVSSLSRKLDCFAI